MSSSWRLDKTQVIQYDATYNTDVNLYNFRRLIISGESTLGNIYFSSLKMALEEDGEHI